MLASRILVSKPIHPVFRGCLKKNNQLTWRNSRIAFQRSRTINLKQVVHASIQDAIVDEEDDDMDPSSFAESMLIGITALVILPKMVNSLHNLKKENTLQKKDMKTNTDHPFKKFFFKDVLEIESNYSVGDEIKIGTLEGTIVDIGPMTTTVVDTENNVVYVPNSSFFTQIVENRSRAECRSVEQVYRFGLKDKTKIHSIVEEIETLMKNDVFVYLGREIPYCHLYQAEKDFEIHIGFNLIRMGEEQLEYAKFDLLSRLLNFLKDEGAIFL